jgi:hypothetical protein
MKVTIEKGTTYADLTDEQGVVIDGIHDMIRELQELIDTMQETIDYNDPLLGHKDPAGYIYNITTDTSKFYRLQERVNNLYNSYGKAVMH